MYAFTSMYLHITGDIPSIPEYRDLRCLHTRDILEMSPEAVIST